MDLRQESDPHRVKRMHDKNAIHTKAAHVACSGTRRVVSNFTCSSDGMSGNRFKALATLASIEREDLRFRSAGASEPRHSEILEHIFAGTSYICKDMYRNATGKAKDLGDTIPDRLAPGFMFHAMHASSVASVYVCARQAAKNCAPWLSF